MALDFKDVLRRLKPEKRREQLRPRPVSQLAFLGQSSAKHAKLLYDTTVYIDILQGRFPRNADVALRAADAWHSTVTEAELSAICGLLDPAHPGSRTIVERVAAVIARRPAHRTITPDREIWLESGVLAGMLGRLQRYGSADRRRILNDALLFSTARKHGLTVLTRNLTDFDLLQQLDPAGRAVFYNI